MSGPHDLSAVVAGRTVSRLPPELPDVTSEVARTSRGGA